MQMPIPGAAGTHRELPDPEIGKQKLFRSRFNLRLAFCMVDAPPGSPGGVQNFERFLCRGGVQQDGVDRDALTGCL